MPSQLLHGVRPEAVAGRFFPGTVDALQQTTDDCLRRAKPRRDRRVPKAVVAPHAGFVYSGEIAGSAFAPWREVASRVRRVVLVGPSHHVPFAGVATSNYAAFRTPFGDVPVDARGVEIALGFDFVKPFERAHEAEHSLETHLPFLQTLFGDFQIVPLVTGDVTPDNLAALLEALWGDGETVLSISSDLSHFHDYETARRIDAQTAGAIVGLEPLSFDHRGACGATAVRGLLVAAKARAMTCEAVDLRNSADTAGSPDRVVGYGAFAFYE